MLYNINKAYASCRNNTESFMITVNKYLILLLLIPALAFGKGNHKLDTTPELESNVWTIQIEENYYHTTNAYDSNGKSLPIDTNYINATIAYSFDFGLDAHIATYNCPLTGGGAQNFECDTYINLTQTIYLRNNINLIIGTQNGTVFDTPAQWHHLDFGVLSYAPIKDIEMHVGSYFVNSNLATLPVDVIGYTGGFVAKFNPKLILEADYFDGHNNISGAQLNFFYKSYYVGVIIPETGSGNQYAGVVGVRFSLGRN
jgi:hypothetical protein